ncbi:uncharacterized protein LOC142519753 [Primulina tabacum]|uniref:uncharacterized protein LOC142519753 n=1 Tax=Primulina tabacum TaxID=48773 RepID=UPI003F5945BA
MSLRQGDLSIVKLIRKFDMGYHFVPIIARDAVEKLRHFMNGLRPTIHRDVMLMRPASYDAATACAFQAEQTLRDIDIDMQRRIFISGVSTYALLDSGATHPFISETFVKRLRIVPEAMDLDFKVSILSGDQMFTSTIVKNVELQLQKNVVQTDLIVLLMPEFDIILSMDWLLSNGASIDIRQRPVYMRPPNGKFFVFEAARNKQMPHIISCICVRKLMKRGCQALLASIVSVSEPVSLRLEDVEIARDFPSVFPEDVSGIPPKRDVDFSIELMLGTSREEHSQHLRTALQTLKDRKLYDKFSKCEFWQERMAFVGHIISRDGVEVDLSKVEAVKDWPVHKSVIEIRSFLGLDGYYRKFIQGFSSIAVPMTTLTEKNAKLIWRSECQESFEKLDANIDFTISSRCAIRKKGAEIQRFELAVYARDNALNLSTLTLQSTLRERIRAWQSSDEQLQK